MMRKRYIYGGVILPLVLVAMAVMALSIHHGQNDSRSRLFEVEEGGSNVVFTVDLLRGYHWGDDGSNGDGSGMLLVLSDDGDAIYGLQILENSDTQIMVMQSMDHHVLNFHRDGDLQVLDFVDDSRSYGRLVLVDGLSHGLLFVAGNVSNDDLPDVLASVNVLQGGIAMEQGQMDVEGILQSFGDSAYYDGVDDGLLDELGRKMALECVGPSNTFSIQLDPRVSEYYHLEMDDSGTSVLLIRDSDLRAAFSITPIPDEETSSHFQELQENPNAKVETLGESDGVTVTLYYYEDGDLVPIEDGMTKCGVLIEYGQGYDDVHIENVTCEVVPTFVDLIEYIAIMLVD